jgi:hypothetical protein
LWKIGYGISKIAPASVVAIPRPNLPKKTFDRRLTGKDRKKIKMAWMLKSGAMILAGLLPRAVRCGKLTGGSK